jgi:hypothetical protein
MGIARAVGAIVFSIIIGLIMAYLFRKEESQRQADGEDIFNAQEDAKERPLWKQSVYFLVLVLILIFAAWGKSKEPVGFWNFIHGIHWYITGLLLIALTGILYKWFKKDELQTWVGSTWTFAKQILPLLFVGVLVAGFLTGRPGFDNGLIPNRYVQMLVGGNSLWANLIASLSGALMYFATLTEVPILQGLMGSGMGKGPALALLLAGPALSLPSMLVLRSIMGTKKTLAYVSLVVVMATITGMIYGRWF